ncbi:unnamed protein product, partial [Pylaiella littoralis]
MQGCVWTLPACLLSEWCVRETAYGKKKKTSLKGGRAVACSRSTKIRLTVQQAASLALLLLFAASARGNKSGGVAAHAVTGDPARRRRT